MKKITLVAIDGLGSESKIYENICNKILKNFLFLNINEVLFFTSNKKYINKKYNIIYLEKPLDYPDLNILMFQKLVDYSSGEHFMIIQPDGYPLNENLWDPKFLEYDYIGAPWPAGMRWTGKSPVVGNGGFSMRSRKLYEKTKLIQGFLEFHKQTLINEDVMISVVIKDYLEQNGIKFAPVELAKQFSIEIPLDNDHNLANSFGFHGKNHLEILKK